MKKKALIRSLIFGLLLFSFNYSVGNNSQIFRQIGINEGLSQVNILSVYQDEMGTMWFGSAEGVNRYNGKEIKIFRPTQSDQGLTANTIHGITGNRKGAIYVRSGKDFVHYDLLTQEFQCIYKDNINHLHFDNDTLWAVTNNEILFFTEENREMLSYMELEESLANTSTILSHLNKLYVGTYKELIEIDKENPSDVNVLLNNEEIRCLYPDKKGNIWVGTATNGAYKITPQREVVNYKNLPDNPNSLSNNEVRAILEDYYGNIWFGTFYGLNKFIPATQQWSVYTHNEYLSHSLSHSSIFALYSDRQGTIWIGTYFGGVNYFNPQSDIYKFYGANMNDPNHISFPFVGKMTEDKKGNLWICTEGGGLNYFDVRSQTFTKYMHQENLPNTISHNNLKCIWYDEQNETLYLGTHTGGLTVYDIQKKRFYQYKNDPDDPCSLPNDIVNEIQYHKGNLLLLTQAGLTYMDMEKKNFYLPFKDQQIIDVLTREYNYETFLVDSRDRLWLAKTSGGVTCIDLNTHKIRQFYHSIDDPGSIGKFKVITIFENSSGRIFFGTLGSGMFEFMPETDSFTNYNVAENKLLSDYCYYIRETSYRYLFVLHNRGVSVFDPVTSHLQHNYNFSLLSFNQGSSIYYSKDGEVYLGGTNGLISFYEQQLYTITNDFNIYFDKLIVNNAEVLPGDQTAILAKSIMYDEEIKLKHNQNNFILEYATSDYLPVTNHRFEYMLSGFDKEWNIISRSQQLTYTNINPGNYILTIRMMDDNNNLLKQKSLTIKIAPPFYASYYAYILYSFLAVTLFYYFIRFNTRQAQLRASLEYERKEKERIEELNQVKLRFFTNISHEFKTPLTLIIGQVESLLQLNKLSPAVYNRMLRIYKNTQHMRNLISELLDFRKQEQGYLKLKVKHLDIVSFSKEIYMSFYEYALKKHINYKFECFDEKIQVWFDPVQLQKVIFNILSNAFKYTEEEGNIQVQIRHDKSKVYIRITDNGVGIPKGSIDKIFERFYQIENLTSGLSLGTGIGLALSKGIIEFHKGDIGVESELGKGSSFTITLLLGNGHFTQEEMNPTEEETASFTQKVPAPALPLEDRIEEEELGEKEEVIPINKPTILIVEDNTDLLDMLEEVFTPIYNVIRANDGKEGLDKTIEMQPDIVLSDVMMPVLSGKEMCYKIKNSIETSHIPVVLLTAQTSVEYKMEGYMFGADDYITKPFNVKLLISRCNNLIKTRKVLLERLKNRQDNPASVLAYNEIDQQLIEKATRIIKENFENPDFDMNKLASELGLGRSKLYTKLKEVTGLTPNEFSLKIKLDEGMRLLNTNPHLTISEISYQIGFSSARYFSKCFKSFYGVAPLTVKKEINGKESGEEEKEMNG